MEQGFITPAALHYLRNHGAVPKINWEEHRLSVGGCVDKPTVFTMDDLLAMPARELPITLVCAGNRRKEENLVAQTIGFNWGARASAQASGRACSCATCSGCGVEAADGNHVCFVGVEKMPKGLRHLDQLLQAGPACDVMLAYEQNGGWPTTASAAPHHPRLHRPA